jgi:regulatory protein
VTPPRSLKARALQLLAQREHSRAELRRKLLAQARADAAPAARAERETAPADAHDDETLDDDAREPAIADGAAQVDAVLDWLAAHHYLSEARFVESRVHARAARFGNLRIRHELAQHDVALSPEAALALKTSELERARAVWARKFAAAPASAAERARQQRFLAGRGFSAEVIRQLLRDAARAPTSDD